MRALLVLVILACLPTAGAAPTIDQTPNDGCEGTLPESSRTENETGFTSTSKGPYDRTCRTEGMVVRVRDGGETLIGVHALGRSETRNQGHMDSTYSFHEAECDGGWCGYDRLDSESHGSSERASGFGVGIEGLAGDARVDTERCESRYSQEQSIHDGYSWTPTDEGYEGSSTIHREHHEECASGAFVSAAGAEHGVADTRCSTGYNEDTNSRSEEGTIQRSRAWTRDSECFTGVDHGDTRIGRETRRSESCSRPSTGAACSATDETRYVLVVGGIPVLP